MATGYTQYINKGITFPTFALKCARAFGALITMRDDSMNEPIPDTIEPSLYHKEEMERAQKELDEASKLTLEEVAVRAAKELEEEILRYRKYNIKKEELRLKYEKMLHEVLMWQPPTADHLELKYFMIQQIEESIKFDCTPVKPVKHAEKTPEDWLRDYIEKCKHDLEYHTKEWQDELNRCTERTEWIRELKKSLGIAQAVEEDRKRRKRT